MEETDHDDKTTRDQDNTANTEEKPSSKRSWKVKELLRVTFISLACLAVLAGAVIGYFYASTPVNIRQPLLEHYHFRLQVLVNGKAENFADAKYQTGYSKDNCNVALPAMPIHFHDGKDQFVHIHWEGTTGGEVLKYYGWNFIGGLPHSLGYRFDNLPKLTSVPIHGDILPAVPNDATFYIYTGDAQGYKQRNFDEFTHQDLEKFLGVTSNFPAHKLNQEKRPTSFLDQLKNTIEPTTYALANAPDDMGGMHMTTTSTTPTSATATDIHTTTTTHSQEELKRINNLLGNVVIFVQKNKPSDQQIKDRFNHLEPLSDSVCGG